MRGLVAGALPSDATICYFSPSEDGAGRAAWSSGPALPQEPASPASLEEAQHWIEVYDEYLQTVREPAREGGLEDELRYWIDRCARRRLYWARARARLKRAEARTSTR